MNDRSSSAPPPAASRMSEVSVSAVVFGVLLGAIMNAAITYAGLKIGFTLVGSGIAAVLGFGVLRGLLRSGTILQVNITQTIASAVNSTNAGIIFTIPALLLMGYTISWNDPEFWLITLATMAGGVLGVVFIGPLRKQMIDFDRLRFPSATAVATILKSPGAGVAQTIVLLAGVMLGAAIYLPTALPQLSAPAAVADLDALVKAGRVSAPQAEKTREMSGWVERKSAPPEVIAAGELVARKKRLLKEAESAGEKTTAAQAKIEEADEMARQLTALPAAAAYGHAACEAAYRASIGEQPWQALQGRLTGWARQSLPGYQDLGVRMPAETAAEGSALSLRVDRDRDGAADHVVTDSTVDVGRIVGLPDQMQLIFAIAPFALGAGYLTGRAGLMVLIGGVLAYLVMNPLAYAWGWLPQTVPAHDVASFSLAANNRPLGIGLLLGGALMGVVAALPAIREAIGSILKAGRSSAAGGRDEMGIGALGVLGLLATAALLLAVELAPQAASPAGPLSALPPLAAKAILTLVALAWIWFAGIIIAQCTGMTDWSPISGMALLTVVLVLVLGGREEVFAAVLLGAALCVAISLASDMMADLKTGYLVGALPRRQQWVEVLTVVIGPVITMATLMIIVQANMASTGLPIGPGTDTTAPQALALKAVITGVQGGEMPYALYGLGSLLGVLLGICAFPGLGVLVGLSIYLPVAYIFTYGIGCIINLIVTQLAGPRLAERWGVPFCAGLVVGEAVLALVINMIVLTR